MSVDVGARSEGVVFASPSAATDSTIGHVEYPTVHYPTYDMGNLDYHREVLYDNSMYPTDNLYATGAYTDGVHAPGPSYHPQMTISCGYGGFTPQGMLHPEYQLVESPQKSNVVIGPNGKPKRRRVATIAQRAAANVRERRRMFNLNEAFDELRKKVPTFAYEKRLSRIETLRLAITYIAFMADIVEGKNPSDVKLLAVRGAGWNLAGKKQDTGLDVNNKDDDPMSPTSSEDM